MKIWKKGGWEEPREERGGDGTGGEGGKIGSFNAARKDSFSRERKNPVRRRPTPSTGWSPFRETTQNASDTHAPTDCSLRNARRRDAARRTQRKESIEKDNHARN